MFGKDQTSDRSKMRNNALNVCVRLIRVTIGLASVRLAGRFWRWRGSADSWRSSSDTRSMAILCSPQVIRFTNKPSDNFSFIFIFFIHSFLSIHSISEIIAVSDWMWPGQKMTDNRSECWMDRQSTQWESFRRFRRFHKSKGRFKKRSLYFERNSVIELVHSIVLAMRASSTVSECIHHNPCIQVILREWMPPGWLWRGSSGSNGCESIS